MCMQNTTNTTSVDARHKVCVAVVLYHGATQGTSLRELDYNYNKQSTNTEADIFNNCLRAQEVFCACFCIGLNFRIQSYLLSKMILGCSSISYFVVATLLCVHCVNDAVQSLYCLRPYAWA